MKAKDQSRFSIDAMRDLAGDKVFARGEAYHRGGQVQILAIEPKRVLAQVAGPKDYRTELTGRGGHVGSHCSCPAFGDWGRAIDGIDDSEGLCSELSHCARDIHLGATESVRPDPVQLARDLFTREVDGDYDAFGDANRSATS
jgi:hypothetical protein